MRNHTTANGNRKGNTVCTILGSSVMALTIIGGMTTVAYADTITDSVTEAIQTGVKVACQQVEKDAVTTSATDESGEETSAILKGIREGVEAVMQSSSDTTETAPIRGDVAKSALGEVPSHSIDCVRRAFCELNRSISNWLG